MAVGHPGVRLITRHDRKLPQLPPGFAAEKRN